MIEDMFIGTTTMWELARILYSRISSGWALDPKSDFSTPGSRTDAPPQSFKRKTTQTIPVLMRSSGLLVYAPIIPH